MSNVCKVYVCSPYSGDVITNVYKAKKYCQRIVDEGKLPIAPHIYFTQFMDDNNPCERERALDYNRTLIDFCDELYVFGDQISSGMAYEIEYATKINKPIIKCVGL